MKPGRSRAEREKESDGEKGGKKGSKFKADSSSESQKCKRCGDGHKTVQCPEQTCGVCGGKGHAAEICANVASVLACQVRDGEGILSGEEAEAFVSEAPGKLSSAQVDEVVVRLIGRWGTWRLFAITGRLVTCPIRRPV